eukprot:CAMPEP_0178370912 /NCGR_PEP_ID=MMETSP0689_2-20121128/551_1 /TAXON_ID=160604 /ORGANISM="Amphidinium massartii, Strain CS-259" /LENGTH=126 /DNA_ID=CAMNT_0019990757 /DNA_START=856 /DNA_END=1233 /DNA_ORIENTATION=+
MPVFQRLASLERQAGLQRRPLQQCCVWPVAPPHYDQQDRLQQSQGSAVHSGCEALQFERSRTWQGPASQCTELRPAYELGRTRVTHGLQGEFGSNAKPFALPGLIALEPPVLGAEVSVKACIICAW